MILTTTDSNLDGVINKLGLFGKSFDDIKRDLETNKGFFKGIFSQSLSKDDINHLKAFNYQIKSGIPIGQAWNNTIKNSSVAAKKAAVDIKAGTKTLKQLEAKTNSASLATKGLRLATSLLNTAIGVGISLVIGYAIESISNYINRFEEYEENIAEFTDKIKEQQEVISGNSKTIGEISDEYAELSKGVGVYGENVSLTSSQYERYLELSNQIAEMYPSLVQSYDEQGNAILRMKGNVDELTQALKDQQKEYYNSLLYGEDAKSTWEDFSEVVLTDDGFFGNVSDFDSQGWGNKTVSRKLDAANAMIKALTDGTFNGNTVSLNGKINGENIISAVKAIKDELGIYDDVIETVAVSGGNLVRITVDDEEKQALIKQITEYANGLNSELEGYMQSLVRPTLTAKVMLDPDLDIDAQGAVSSIIQSLDFEWVKQFSEDGGEIDKDAMLAWLQSNLIEPFKDPKFAEEWKEQLENVTKFQNGDITIGKFSDIQNEFQEFLNKLDIDPETKSLLCSIIFDKVEIAEDVSTEDAVSNILSRAGLSKDVKTPMGLVLYTEYDKDATNWLNTLSYDELQHLYEYSDLAGKSLSDLKSIIDDYQNSQPTLSLSSEDLLADLENINSAYSTVEKAVSEYNENGYVSFETIKALTEVDAEYINALINEQGELDLTSQKYKDLTKAKLEQLKVSLLNSIIDEVNAITTQEQALKYLGEQQENATKSSLDLAKARWKEVLTSRAALDIEQGTGDLYYRTAIAGMQKWQVMSSLIDSYGDSLGKSSDYKNSLEEEKEALEDAKSALEEKKSALEDTKSGYEDAINSIKDLIDWTEKYIKQTKQDEIDALEEQKQKIDDLIDSKKELLQAEKDEYEWNKEISEKQNTVASDALSAAAASLDDSSAGQKSYKEASDTLSDSRSDLYDSLYTHEIDTRIEALDALKEQNDQYYEEQIESINAFLNDEVTLHKAACSMIDNDNGTLYGKLLNYARTYTTTTDAEFNYMWSSAKSAMQNYNTANLDTFSLLNNLQSRIYEVDGAIDNIADSISSYEDKISGVQSKLDNLTNSAKTSIETINNLVDSLKPYWSVSHNGRMFYSYQESKDKAASDLANQLRAAGLSDTANSVWDKMKKYKSSYAKGTKSAKGGISRVDEEGLYSELIPYKVGEGRYTILPEGNPVFSKNMTDELYDFASNPSEYIKYLASNTTELMPDNDYYYKAYKDNIPLIDYSGLYKTNFDKEVREILNTTSNSVYHNEQIPSPTININIQGDATQSTVKALQLEADKIVDRATKNVMNIALKNKRII